MKKHEEKNYMECAAKVSQDIARFMDEADLNEAFLFGGSVLDPLTRENAKISDYDICVKDKEIFYATLKNLEGKNYNLSEVMRTHNIYVVIRHAELGQIDFSCMNPEDNGIFNVEKIYAKFKRQDGAITNTVVDKYGAIESIKRGEIRLACNPEDEGAYNLLRRFLAIVGKYGLDISPNGINQETINQIKEEFAIGRHYIPQDKVRCLSRLPASLRRTQDRQRFVTDLGQQHIFEKAFPEIDRLFNDKIFQQNEKLKTCETQKGLLLLMVSHTTKTEERDALIDCLRILSRREAARQDKGVKTFVEELENEKTSINRLNKKILLPLFKFKQSEDIK